MAQTAEGTTGTTVISVNKPTPTWATWIFRIVFILTGVATFIIMGSTMISTPAKVELALWLKGLDMAVWGITRVLGVDVTRDYGDFDKN